MNSIAVSLTPTNGLMKCQFCVFISPLKANFGENWARWTIVLDHQSETPLHQQLYDELRQAILNGRATAPETALHQINCPIAPHFAPLPQSYDRLQSEGYLDTVVGSGTYVCVQLPDDLMQPISHLFRNQRS